VPQPQAEPIRRQQVKRPIRPLDQQRPDLPGLLEAELGEFVAISAFQPVEVGVSEREAGQVVHLDEREGRARHGDVGARPGPDHGPRQLRLAGPQVALQRQHVARAQQRRQARAEGPGRRKVVQAQVGGGRRRST
jgi:hypothetical protein